MTNLMPGRMNRRNALSPLGLGLLRALVLSSPLLAGGACAEKQGLEIPPAGGGGGTEPPLDPDQILRCGADGQRCGGGDGCCLAGNTCSAFGRCIPADPCSTDADCSSDSVCGGSTCVPFDNLLQRFSSSCRTNVDLPSLTPEIRCEWPGNTVVNEFPEAVQVIGTPMVVDFNFDNNPRTRRPSIVFVSYTGTFDQVTGVLRVIDGESCGLQATIAGSFLFTPKVPPALGDIDNDGRPDIIVADEEALGTGGAVRSGVAVYSAVGDGSTDFQLLTRRISAGTNTIQGLALADVDGDDFPEIFTNAAILDFDPAEGTIGDRAQLQLVGRATLIGREPPIVLDIDGDRQAEIVSSQGVFFWDIPTEALLDKPRAGSGANAFPLWNEDPTSSGFFVAMADLGNFPTQLPSSSDSAEMVVVGSGGEIFVKLVDGNVMFRANQRNLGGGPPVIADFDGDGHMEFASPGFDELTVFDMDCLPANFEETGRFCKGGRGSPSATAIAWQSPIRGARSGAAVFDFDGDRKAEVVYADQCYLRIYDGTTGDVIFSTPRTSTTQWEYPVVADVNGDTFSDLVVASNDNDSTVLCTGEGGVPYVSTHGVTVWREKDNLWAGSRPIWNQHNYHVTNVRDDGTIPPMGEVQNHWKGGPNTFRQNVQGETGASLDLADVTTAGLPTFECIGNQSRAKVTMDVCNRGLRTMGANAADVVLVREDAPSNVLCTIPSGEALESGFCRPVSCEIDAGPTPFNITIIGDPSAKVDECNENNNRSLISRVSCVPVPD
jgi:VCBS repeat protein